MAFTIRNMFSSGDTPEGGATVSTGDGPGSSSLPQGFANSPFAMAGNPQGGGMPDAPNAPMNMGGFGNPGVPAFKPISEEAFRTGALEARPSGGSPFLSMGDQSPSLVVGDILPSLPPEVARGNGAPMDQPVHLAPAVLDAARQDGSHSVSLFEIFRVCPALFQVPVSPADPRRVRIPKLAPASPTMSPQLPAAVPSPSPFGMAPQGGSPSPFAAMVSPPPAMHTPPASMMPQPDHSAPSSRPIGTLPPRRPDGVPPSIPTQNDFAAPPTLQLPGSPMFGSRDVAAPAGESPFAMAFSATPTSPAPSNFISPPKPEVPEMQGFGMPQSGSPFAAAPAPSFAASPFAEAIPAPAPSFGASPFADAAAPAPAPSPFLSSPPLTPAMSGPKSGPLASMFAASPNPSAPPVGMPSPFGSDSVPPAANGGAPMFGAGGPSPFASPAPSFEPPAARPTSRPLMPAPASRPLPMPPPLGMPTGIGETVEMALSSIVKGNNPQDLGFDPNFIPAWIMTKLPAYLVKQQAGAQDIFVELGAVIDGTDETFRPIIAHGKRDFKVKLPHNEVFHALPQVNAAPAPAPMPSFAPPPAPAPVASPAPIGGPVQPVGLQGLTSAFALGASSGASSRVPDSMPPPAPASRPLFTPAAQTPPPAAPAGSWQSVAAPAPLFSAAPPAPEMSAPPPAMPLPLTPMPEITPPPAAPLNTFGNVAFAAPAPEPAFAPAAFVPQMPPSAPPVPMGISTGSGERDQLVLRALLGVSGRLTREMVVESVARLPRVEACVFVQGNQTLQNGASSPAASEFVRQGVELSRSLKTLASAIGIGEAETLSVNSDSRLVTFSFHETAALGILHADRESAAGLREKVSLLCKELAGMSPV